MMTSMLQTSVFAVLLLVVWVVCGVFSWGDNIRATRASTALRGIRATRHPLRFA